MKSTTKIQVICFLVKNNLVKNKEVIIEFTNFLIEFDLKPSISAYNYFKYNQ